MTSETGSTPERQQRLRRLVKLAREESFVDTVVERLRAPDGSAWLSTSLEEALSTGGASVRHLLTSGAASVEQLRELKKRSKELAYARKEDPPPIALAGYLLATAAALAHHDTLISTRPRSQIRDTLKELAESLEGSWKELVEKAIAVLRSEDVR
jgi:hypothetical protein